MRTTTLRLAFVTALVGVISVSPASGQSAAPAPFDVVKVSHAELRWLVGEAQLRSPTFRDLAEKIRASGWLVFLQSGPCPTLETALGCLTDYVGSYEGSRYLRVFVNHKGRYPDSVIATIAHELQHAVEVAEAPDVIDRHGLRTLFQTIGSRRVRRQTGTTYDTAEAREVEAQVKRELSVRKRERQGP
jgi:hypothetical protein